MDNQIFITAIKYAKDGLPLIPLCAYDHEGIDPNSMHATKICKCPGKVALIKWKEITETTQKDIVDWKRKYKAFNIGMPLGSTSGYVGIDIDGEEGQEMFNAMTQGKNVPDTWEYTSGEGRRLLFTIPIGLKTKKFVNTGQGKHQECSILADGQYTVLPPSIHHTGKRYTWRLGHSPEEIDCALAPTWLLDLITDKEQQTMKKRQQQQELILNLETAERNPLGELSALCVPCGWSEEMPPDVSAQSAAKIRDKSSGNVAEPTKTWEEMDHEIVTEGGRNNAITKYIGSLLADPSIRRLGKNVALVKVKEYNATCLQPPLEEEEFLVQFEAFWESEQAKDAQYAVKSNGKLPWNAYDVLDTLRNKLTELGLIYVYDATVRTLYYCTNTKGPWMEDLEDCKISGIIRDILINHWKRTDWVRPRNLKEVVDLFKGILLENGKGGRGIFVEAGNEILQRYLPVNGNRLDWRTGELLPWSPDFLTRANFDIPYDPDARCPYWDRYVEEWLPDEPSREYLQMFLGAALLPKTDPCGVFIILLGNGANGKSMFMNAIESIFGNTSTAQELSRLSERFGPSILYGKRLNICSELEDDSRYLTKTGILKRLVTGETLNIEFKGKDSFDYLPIASHIFSCNTLPNTSDKTDGWFRRRKVISFDQTFTPDGGVAAVMQAHIRDERAGIFNWLLEGLRKLEKNNWVYPRSEKMERENQELRLEQDTVGSFAATFLRKIRRGTEISDYTRHYGKDRRIHGIGVRFLYLLFDAWYRMNISNPTGNIPISAKKFKDDLHKRLKFEIEAHKMCLVSEKYTNCVTNVDFTYSDEMCDFIDELLREDEFVLKVSSGDYNRQLQQILRYSKMRKKALGAE